jgi:hypothetical protein
MMTKLKDSNSKKFRPLWKAKDAELLSRKSFHFMETKYLLRFVQELSCWM